MGRVYTCVGRMASVPYTIKNACVRVNCIEELCFYIVNNAHFIEDDFIDTDMLTWFEEECNLPALARKVRSAARSDNRSERLIRTILENVHCCSEDEIDETVNVLKANRNISPLEKLRIRGDFFLKNEKYSLAESTYQDLIHMLDPKKDTTLLAFCYHNLGVVYARLFMFESAADLFKQAYDIDGDMEHMVQYQACYRMIYNDDTFLRRIASNSNNLDAVGELENRLDAIVKKWNESDEAMRIRSVTGLKNDGHVAEYDAMSNAQIAMFKEDYRLKYGYDSL